MIKIRLIYSDFCFCWLDAEEKKPSDFYFYFLYYYLVQKSFLRQNVHMKMRMKGKNIYWEIRVENPAVDLGNWFSLRDKQKTHKM